MACLTEGSQRPYRVGCLHEDFKRQFNIRIDPSFWWPLDFCPTAASLSGNNMCGSIFVWQEIMGSCWKGKSPQNCSPYKVNKPPCQRDQKLVGSAECTSRSFTFCSHRGSFMWLVVNPISTHTFCPAEKGLYWTWYWVKADLDEVNEKTGKVVEAFG